MHTSYQSLANYYDLMHARRDYAGEAAFIHAQIKNCMPQAKSLLDVGCGTGTHLKHFTQYFTHCAGVDINADILKVAQEKVPEAILWVSSMTELHAEKSYDVVTCLYSVFNYNLTLEEGLKTLHNFYTILNPGGLLFLALYEAMNTAPLQSMHVGKKDNVEVAKINQYKTNPDTLTQLSDYLVLIKQDGKIDFHVETNHAMKIYPMAQLKKMLQETGFSQVDVYQGFTNQPLAEGCLYPLVIAQK